MIWIVALYLIFLVVKDSRLRILIAMLKASTEETLSINEDEATALIATVETE